MKVLLLLFLSSCCSTKNQSAFLFNISDKLSSLYDKPYNEENYRPILIQIDSLIAVDNKRRSRVKLTDLDIKLKYYFITSWEFHKNTGQLSPEDILAFKERMRMIIDRRLQME